MGQPLGKVGQEPGPRFTFANERTFLAWNRTALRLGSPLGYSGLVRLLAVGVAVTGVVAGVLALVDVLSE